MNTAPQPELAGPTLHDTVYPQSVSTGRVRSRWVKRSLRWTGLLLIIGLSVLGGRTALVTTRYHVSLALASKSVARETALGVIHGLVTVYDPYQPRKAVLGPAGVPCADPSFARIETVFAPGTTVLLADGGSITLTAFHNEQIVRSSYPFAYQPWDAPRLKELRRRYRLDEVVATASSELEAMALLRSWFRYQFPRNAYRTFMSNFDVLTFLDQHEGLARSPSSDSSKRLGKDLYDACHFFPLGLCQVFLSMGYQARLVSVGHGVVEVWSNQFGKWIYMDAEFDHHVMKDGVPLNAADMLAENYTTGPTQARVVRGARPPGAENPTMVHLKMPQLLTENIIPWFNTHIQLVDLRNDWLTNHYVPGHPARSEANALVLVHPMLGDTQVQFGNRLRPHTRNLSDFYWTIDQAEILARRGSENVLDLRFDTVTPNFESFEVIVDLGLPVRSSSPEFAWRLHKGDNHMTVRPVNAMGVRGVESRIDLLVRPGSRDTGRSG